MKNKFYRTAIVIAMLIISLQASFGQQNFQVGVKAGIGIPNLSAGGGSNPVSQGWSSRLGPYFGAVATYKLSPKFYIQAELNYASQGGKKNGEQAIPTGYFTNAPPPGTPDYVYANIKSETRLNYIELPILAKYSVHIGGRCSFFIDAGPYFGYLVAAKNAANGNTNFYADEAETTPLLPQAVPFDVTQDIKSDIKKFNMGIQGGIGLSATAPGGSVMLSIGGNYGFIPIQKDKANGQNVTGAATLTVGYLFTL